jgi:hypothetical protein
MLDLISVIADETIREIEAEPPYGLSAWHWRNSTSE